MREKVLGIFLLVILFAASIPEVEASKVVLEFFYHTNCVPCKEPKKLLERLQQDYSPNVTIEWMNMRFMNAIERFLYYNMSLRPSVVFNHDPSTAEYNLSEENLRPLIEFHSDNPSIADGSNGGPHTELIDRVVLTLPMVLISGLVDGINPCAFSLLIFFLSFLFGLRRTRGSVFGMGLTYIVGVFIGYISIGLGLLRSVSIMGVSNIFGLLGGVLLAFLGLMQIRDATTFDRPLMVFPRFVVPTFKKLTERATYPIALLLGLIASVFEFPCSGSVYFGVLFLLASKTRLFEGAIYLVLYNLMFVSPLLLLLLAGSSSDALIRMDEWRVVNRRRLKLVSGLFLLLLAAVTIYIIYL